MEELERITTLRQFRSLLKDQPSEWINEAWKIIRKRRKKEASFQAREFLDTYLTTQRSIREKVEERCFIYILRLEKGKFYVGRCSSLESPSRIEQHFRGRGSEWTKKYPPLEVERIYLAYPLDEDRYTKEMMILHGIENVRGGTYCGIRIPRAATRFLRREIANATDCCVRCGCFGHYQCSNKRIDLYGNRIKRRKG